MEVIIQDNAESASRVGAEIVKKIVTAKQNAILGLATGQTPLLLYRELVRMHRKEGLDFSGCTTFNLDEYVGLDKDHPASYNSYMRNNLFKHLNIPDDQINIPDGMSDDIPSVCINYEKKIAKLGGIDLQILGIGADGHIAFNEPISSLKSRTRIKTLMKQTKRDNAQFFNGDIDQVPNHVITMGVATIMDSQICLMLAFGEEKAKAIAATIEGPISAMVPASALQMHQNTIVIIDEAAASKLNKTQYYRYVYENKPQWQKY